MFYTEVPQACIARMKHINLSFAACGFLGIYHLGAASALCKHGKNLLKSVQAFAGASAGSLVASVLLTAPQKIEECNEFTYSFAEEIRRQTFGAVTPGYDFMARLRSGVEAILPPNAHELAHDRLHVSITNTETRENYLASSFPSREDLIEVLLASSFVPVYAGLKPVEYKGQKWVDGGFTNSLPLLPVGRTVTISPFSGRMDISPQGKGQLDFYVTITKQDILDSPPLEFICCVLVIGRKITGDFLLIENNGTKLPLGPQRQRTVHVSLSPQ
ncbi:patatin-like phospholipase domain-containing protein 4 isoform X1 [Eschrichtius robustus]|uniref:patatin-like phospholipase domain-containing protein 4 isoform X1 n=1 Tax=Eschrichtius robustus TaxID=9764 RepID=UPI0035C013FE